MSEGRLRDFVRESNRIEGIEQGTEEEIDAHERFLALDAVTVGDLEWFVGIVADAPLRDKPGMNVQVGNHLPPYGSPDIRGALNHLLNRIQGNALRGRDPVLHSPGFRLTPYEAHIAYEQLHPFMDGNGRSGRVLWAWQMQRDGLDPFSLPFLHRFYYQTLDASRD